MRAAVCQRERKRARSREREIIRNSLECENA